MTPAGEVCVTEEELYRQLPMSEYIADEIAKTSMTCAVSAFHSTLSAVGWLESTPLFLTGVIYFTEAFTGHFKFSRFIHDY